MDSDGVDGGGVDGGGVDGVAGVAGVAGLGWSESVDGHVTYRCALKIGVGWMGVGWGG